MTRETTKARAYNYLAMWCDGYLKLNSNSPTYPQDIQSYSRVISTLCEVLKIGNWVNLDLHSIVAKYRPDLFKQAFYDDIRQFYKMEG
jgi:hypothetical protein